MSGEKVRRFRQFYVEFRAPLIKGNMPTLGRLAAHTLNVLADRELDIELIQYRNKLDASEFRILATLGVEVKVGVSDGGRGWIHVSVQADGSVKVNHEELAEAILKELKGDLEGGE